MVFYFLFTGLSNSARVNILTINIAIPIHNGIVTNHHDIPITPASLSTSSTINTTPKIPNGTLLSFFNWFICINFPEYPYNKDKR